MIFDNCVYNEICDNSPVEQYGFVDLCEVISNGAVPTSVSDTDLDYNDIEDPASILGKPHDVFEAYRLQDYVKRAGTKSDNKSDINKVSITTSKQSDNNTEIVKQS